MNLYIVFSQAFVFTILIIQNRFIKEVAASREQRPEVADWFNSLEKKLNDVMHDVFQGVRDTALEAQPGPTINTEDVIDKDNKERKSYDLFRSRELQEHFMPQIEVNGENIPGERDVLPDVLQDVRATAWAVQPDSIKNTEDIIDKYNEEKNAYYDMYKSRELQEKFMSQIAENGENIPGEREVSSVYLHSDYYETTATPRPIRKKKIRKMKKKSHKLKPKRLGLGKSKKEQKNQEHMKKNQEHVKMNHEHVKKKQHPKRKSNNQERKKFIYEQKPNVSEHNVSFENKNRGKPVDIIVHIKMNE